jgi:cytochrome c biogenesis protein CcmG, thiol:disulfide interchange protein DsbE
MPHAVEPPKPARKRDIFSWILYVALALLVLRWLSPAASGPKEDGPAPPFDLPVVAGGSGRVTLEQFRGAPAVIEVFASWCRACRDMAPTLSKVAGARRERAIRVLGISVDDEAETAAQAQRRDALGFPVAHGGGEFSRRYGITVLPTILVLDEQGRIRHSTTGYTREGTLEGWLTTLGAKKLR